MKKILTIVTAALAVLVISSTAVAGSAVLPQYATGTGLFGASVIPAVVTIDAADVADGQAVIAITSEGYGAQIRSYPLIVKATQTVTEAGTYTVNAYCKSQTGTYTVKVLVDGVSVASRNYKCR